MSFFEILMLVCFGMAWPFSIYKSATSKSVEGKSVFFLIVILVGYTSGILHKLYYSYDKVIYLYMINFVMVFIDMLLYFRNKKIKRRVD